MSHRMDEIKPEHYITEQQCQEMIDKAIDKHNKTATVISAILGGILLAFYSHGVLSLVGRVQAAVTPLVVQGQRRQELPPRGVAQFGRALALGASGRRFKSFHPDCIHTTTMHFYSVEYWQENWETLMDRVEKGETIGVENENGDRAVMTPADDELIRMYTDHEEGS